MSYLDEYFPKKQQQYINKLNEAGVVKDKLKEAANKINKAANVTNKILTEENLINYKKFVDDKAQSIAFNKMMMLGIIIVSIIIYASMIIYFYHIAKSEKQINNINFVHGVLWGSEGTDGAFLVASKFAANFLIVVAGINLFKALSSEGERQIRMHMQ
jgi:hypothetical protein